MEWIVSLDREIAVDFEQMIARRDFIKQVTGAEVTAWRIRRFPGLNKEFAFCISEDNINGIFITAHIGDVQAICSQRNVVAQDVIVANSCIWLKDFDKDILRNLYERNPGIELWFAKQELYQDGQLTLRQSVKIENIGQFGFRTSTSERRLFARRKKGFLTALSESFEKISPIY